jgi:hypothetical protein
LKDQACLSFTIVGSDGKHSEDLCKEYISGNDDVYVEFKQTVKGDYYSNSNFRQMLEKKFSLGLTTSYKKDKDISLMMGSNDFIAENFFIQLVNKYRNGVPQMYGISNGLVTKNNVCIFYDITPEKNRLDNTTLVGIWNMKYPNPQHGKIIYGGGCIGFNRTALTKSNRNAIYFRPCNEIVIEKKVVCNKVLFTNVFFLSIKSDNDMSPIKENWVANKDIDTISSNIRESVDNLIHFFND